jgi:C-terminal processing protease CtpA/Prc
MRLRISGADAFATSPTYEDFTVEKLKKHSPAEQAGIKVGDHIQTINRSPIGTLTLQAWMKLSYKSGTSCELGIRRGDQIMTLPLVLDWECYLSPL